MKHHVEAIILPFVRADTVYLGFVELKGSCHRLVEDEVISIEKPAMGRFVTSHFIVRYTIFIYQMHKKYRCGSFATVPMKRRGYTGSSLQSQRVSTNFVIDLFSSCDRALRNLTVLGLLVI